MTRCDFLKPAFSLRQQRFVKTHAISLLGTKNLRFALLRFQDLQHTVRSCPYFLAKYSVLKSTHQVP